MRYRTKNIKPNNHIVVKQRGQFDLFQTQIYPYRNNLATRRHSILSRRSMQPRFSLGCSIKWHLGYRCTICIHLSGSCTNIFRDLYQRKLSPTKKGVYLIQKKSCVIIPRSGKTYCANSFGLKSFGIFRFLGTEMQKCSGRSAVYSLSNNDFTHHLIVFA